MACGKFHKSTKSGFLNFLKNAGKGILDTATTVAPLALQAAQTYAQFKH